MWYKLIWVNTPKNVFTTEAVIAEVGPRGPPWPHNTLGTNVSDQGEKL